MLTTWGFIVLLSTFRNERNFPQTSSFFNMVKTEFIYLLPSLMPAPPMVSPSSINGTSICLAAQGYKQGASLPSPLPLPHQKILLPCLENTPSICPPLSVVLPPTMLLSLSPGSLQTPWNVFPGFRHAH